jgi:O-antigen ligase
MFIVGLQTFNTMNKFKLLLRVIVIALILQELYFLYSNVTGIGKKSYMDDSILFGETGVNMTKAMVIFLITIPVFLRIEENTRWRLIALIIFFIGIVIVLFGMKRSAILAMLFGFLIYILFTPFKSRVIQFLPIVLIVAIVTSPLYFPIIEKRFESRQQRVSMSYKQLKESESEGRLLEIQFTIEDALEEGSGRLFFGFDLFLKKDFNGHKRMLHVDYMNMLGGAGILGLALFLFLYFKIAELMWRIRDRMRKNKIIIELFATGFALLAVQAFLSVGGTMQGVNLRGYILFILGGILSVMFFSLQKQRASYVAE